MKRYTRDTFNLRDRIEGASKHSIILKGDDGEKIFCSLKVFNQIMNDASIEFIVQTVPAHDAGPHGGYRRYPESKWICAYLPTRLGFMGM